MSKEEKYRELYTTAEALLREEVDEVAKMANMAALLHQEMHFWWTGFYRVCNEELILGPFQGPLACMHIAYGRGVCGTAWKEGRTIVVEDVELFPVHIACSAESRSEIVVPLWREGKVCGVLDIDSEKRAFFDDCDALWLEKIASLI